MIYRIGYRYGRNHARRSSASPALASLDVHQRTIYLGTFSKTISPSLRLGFVVVPRELVNVTTRAVAIGAPAPSPLVQHIVTRFMRDEHYLRHLRRMKALYRRNAAALLACISRNLAPEFIAGLAVLVRLQPGTDDRSIAEEARRLGFAPSALSAWYANQDVAISGLLLGVTNVDDASAQLAWRTLKRLISRHKLNSPHPGFQQAVDECSDMVADFQDVRAIAPRECPLGFYMLKGDELYQFYVSAPARGAGVAAALMDSWPLGRRARRVCGPRLQFRSLRSDS